MNAEIIDETILWILSKKKLVCLPRREGDLEYIRIGSANHRRTGELYFLAQ